MDPILVDAETLTQFSNLTPERVEEFRNNVGKGFVPDSLWSSSELGSLPSENKPAWRQVQALLRQAWKNEFSPQESVTLIMLVGFYSQIFEEEHDRPAHIEAEAGSEGGMNIAKGDLSRSLPLEAPSLDRLPKAWPFQQAVMFFAMNHNRAVFCLKCAKRFFKLEKNTKYCSDECSQKARRTSMLDWWNATGKKRRLDVRKSAQKAAKKKGTK